MAINILIIDDDKRAVERLVNNLKRADDGNEIGECIVDDSVIAEDNLEKYNPLQFDVKFDVLLVDYQLNSKFTGVLVAAWIMLQFKIPKLTLTTGMYPGPKDCFDGFLIKDELLENPKGVIAKLIQIVNTFNAKQWIENQHRALVEEYQTLVEYKANGKINYSDENMLLLLEKLLDKFEKVIDEEQEKEIKRREIMLEEKSNFSQMIEQQTTEIDVLSARLEEYLGKLEAYDE